MNIIFVRQMTGLSNVRVDTPENTVFSRPPPSHEHPKAPPRRDVGHGQQPPHGDRAQPHQPSRPKKEEHLRIVEKLTVFALLLEAKDGCLLSPFLPFFLAGLICPWQMSVLHTHLFHDCILSASLAINCRLSSSQ